jgi:sec-independent protein translocase protein TatB
MPSFLDSAFIFILALLLFGPKKLPELARQLGKLMSEFRRASNEFRIQMDEELRVADQAEQQKKIADMEAAAPVVPLPGDHTGVTPDDPEYPSRYTSHDTLAPLPIAEEGDLTLMPPATGLPTPRSSESAAEAASLAPILDTIPHTSDPYATNIAPSVIPPYEASTYTPNGHSTAESKESNTEAPLHG